LWSLMRAATSCAGLSGGAVTTVVVMISWICTATRVYRIGGASAHRLHGELESARRG
jgi:hypothetical protein